MPEKQEFRPAFIRMCPPSPETSKRWWELCCPVCRIHEGLADSYDTPWLVEKRDDHNAQHAAARNPLSPLPSLTLSEDIPNGEETAPWPTTATTTQQPDSSSTSSGGSASRQSSAPDTEPLLVSSMRRHPHGQVRFMPEHGIGMSGTSTRGFLRELDEHINHVIALSVAAAYTQGVQAAREEVRTLPFWSDGTHSEFDLYSSHREAVLAALDDLTAAAEAAQKGQN